MVLDLKKSVFENKGVSIFMIILSLVFFISSYSFNLIPITTGFVGLQSTGQIALEIATPFNLTIHSPLNTTYVFNGSDEFRIYLNVSANKAVSTWTYDLWDLRDGEVLTYGNVAFTPNTSFVATRGDQKLVVYANSIINKTVYFFVNTKIS